MFHETLMGTCWGVKGVKAEDQRSELQWCHNVHVESLKEKHFSTFFVDYSHLSIAPEAFAG